MTPLPAFQEKVLERRDLPEYEIEPRCANPRCPNRAEHPHEIRPRSQTSGMVWWVEIPGRFLLGNRVGLCAGCHRRTDDHTVAILWDDEMQEFAWLDLDDDFAGSLDPMPPIHKVDAGTPRVRAEPVLERQDVEGLEQLGKSMQNMERFLETVRDQDVHGVSFEKAGERVDPLEVEAGLPVRQEIQPVELEPDPDDFRSALAEAGGMIGDDERTVQIAREKAAELEQRAVDVTGLGEFQPQVAPWRAEVAIFVDEDRVEVLHGDLRVGDYLEERIEKAKRAPKPREPKPELPEGEREPKKARRTWSVSVPADVRDGEKVAAGEDGYQLIEEALENLRQRFGRDEFPGWKYYVLMDALGWILLNYTDEGED